MPAAEVDPGIVVVLTAEARESELTREALGHAGIEARICGSFEELMTAVGGLLGAVVVAEETIPPGRYGAFAAALAAHPPWSDLPLIVVADKERVMDGAIDRVLTQLGGNVTVLERPVRSSMVVTAVRSALRARGRQVQLRDVLAHLEEQDRRKNEFLAMLGHELRNPLAAIHNALQVMQHAPGPDVLARQPVIIERQARHLARIVDDLLDVTRVTMGRINLERRVLDLGELSARCLVAFEAQAAAEGHQLMARNAPWPVLVEADGVRIEQVLSNLVSNAFKYTPRGGHIEIAVDEDGDEAVLSVRDDGIGIPPEVLPRIFELFMQEAPSLDRSRGGLGLGLALVRSLVELHGGRVEARSDGRDRGSAFSVRLPLAAGGRTAESSTPAGPVAARPLRVVVIEDNDDARETMQTLLEVWGHTVWVASEGVAGLELLLSVQPDVALIDIGLPRLDGYEVARQARNQSPRVPLLIAMTGYGQPEDRARALKAGFDTHLVKPVQATDLARALRRGTR